MATKANDSSTSKKEKRVTPSSNSHTTHRQGPKSSIPAGSTDKDKATVSGSAKPIPNYLKPTFSSRSESFTCGKKPSGHEDPSAQKHALLRRRSFDRPPSASHVQKSLISPHPKDTAGSRDRTLTVQSMPLSSKPAALERTSRSPNKPVKIPTAPAARPRKRSSSFPRSISTSTSTENEHRPHVSFKTPSHDHEHESNKESVAPEAEETLKVEREEPVPFNVPKAENKEEVDAVDTQVNKDEEEEKLKGSDISIVLEGQSEYLAAQTKETEKELHEEDIERENENEGAVNHREDKGSNAQPKEVVVEEAKVAADQEEVGENEHENAASSEEPVDKKKDEDIKVDEGSEELESKEGQDVVNGVEEAKPEAADLARKQQVTGQGNSKKESPGAYNDVIEETKNKLLEKRKNKVKALVGAYETVIDYESSSK